ncbi:protease modulator HflC [Saccharospirillum alexandrii]|uniref:protease modulator HflC n=1 Tax=Saccharospirillum alexandrii TaxID=2448477 RepID=UPI000FDC48E5|nr:protease modulator HflC [Saccharospirillum alexandrii]
MSTRNLVLLAALALVVFVGLQSVYVVSEKERAIKLRFGEVVAADVSPGLNFKVPFIEVVRKFERRIITLDSDSERFITSEQKGLEVDAYVQWQIDDVRAFYTATSGGDFFRANTILANRINSALRDAFGRRTLREVVSGRAEDEPLSTGTAIEDEGERDRLMREVTSDVDGFARSGLGIRVIDIRVKAIDLPQEVSADVFSRMRSDREQEARLFRSNGEREAEEIRASADRQETVITANAFREAEQIRGEGDAEASRIYSTAYSEDSEFYGFYRSLRAYEDSFGSGGDILLLEPDNDFFRYLQSKGGVLTTDE